jgi:MFS family permease
VPLILAAMTGGISAAGILLVAAAYWGTGLATGPAWNTWMGTLVPRPVRARFFANRTRVSQFAVLAGLVAAGCLLQRANSLGMATAAFAGIFLAAGLCRLTSMGLLSRQYEPELSRTTMPSLSIGRVWSQIRHTGSGRLVLYLAAVQGAVQFAGPYFTPYMFRWLHLSYLDYVILIAAAYLAKVVTLSAWGSVAHRLGAMRLLWIGGIGIAPVSALWIVSDNFFWLLLLQAIAGIVWGAYELGFFLMFFESIPEDERTGVLTFYNLANTTTWVIGSTLGGLLLYAMGTTPAAYLTLFVVSSIGRVLALLLLKRVPSTQVRSAQIGVRTIAVRPMAASMDAPILPSLPDQTGEPKVEAATIFTAS